MISQATQPIDAKQSDAAPRGSARLAADRDRETSAYWAHDAMGPLRPFLEDETIVEISGQKPGEVWVERLGSLAMTKFPVQAWTEKAAHDFAISIASYSKQVVNAQKPLLSAALPGGERVQFCLYPTSTTGTAFSIRKQVIRDMSLSDYAKMGSFDQLRIIDETSIDPMTKPSPGFSMPAMFRAFCVSPSRTAKA